VDSGQRSENFGHQWEGEGNYCGPKSGQVLLVHHVAVHCHEHVEAFLSLAQFHFWRLPSFAPIIKAAMPVLKFVKRVGRGVS